MKNFANTAIQNLPQVNWGYTQTSAQAIDLLRGENLEVPDFLQQAIADEANNINLYPAQNNQELLEKLTNYLRVSPENLFLSNGSDDAIECIAKVFVEKGDQVLVPLPSFPTYATASKFSGASVESFSLFDSGGQKILPTAEVAKLIKQKCQQGLKIVWLASPNNPTGNLLLTNQQLDNLLTQFPRTLFVIDECYSEFAKRSAISLTQKYSNLLIIGSFSKSFALAGLRFGYVVGNSELISYLNRLQTLQPFRVNRISQKAAVTLLGNPQQMKKMMANFQSRKKEFEASLARIKQLKVWPTLASFSFFELITTQLSATQFAQKLAQQGVLLKDCSIYGNTFNRFIRVGIPNQIDQEQVVRTIQNIFIEQ